MIMFTQSWRFNPFLFLNFSQSYAIMEEIIRKKDGAKMLKVDLKNLKGFIRDYEIDYLDPQVKAAHQTLHDHSGPGHDFLGWVDLPKNYDKAEFDRV